VSVDEVPVDKLEVDELLVYQLEVDELSVYDLPWYQKFAIEGMNPGISKLNFLSSRSFGLGMYVASTKTFKSNFQRLAIGSHLVELKYGFESRKTIFFSISTRVTRLGEF
jgi:hypothetical protein